MEYRPISARDQSKLHQIGKTFLFGIFLGYVLIAGYCGMSGAQNKGRDVC